MEINWVPNMLTPENAICEHLTTLWEENGDSCAQLKIDEAATWFFGPLIDVTLPATRFAANVWNMLHDGTCRMMDSAECQTCNHREEVEPRPLHESIYFPKMGNENHLFQSWCVGLSWIWLPPIHLPCQGPREPCLSSMHLKMMRQTRNPKSLLPPQVEPRSKESRPMSECLTKLDLWMQIDMEKMSNCTPGKLCKIVPDKLRAPWLVVESPCAMVSQIDDLIAPAWSKCLEGQVDPLCHLGYRAACYLYGDALANVSALL